MMVNSPLQPSESIQATGEPPPRANAILFPKAPTSPRATHPGSNEMAGSWVSSNDANFTILVEEEDDEEESSDPVGSTDSISEVVPIVLITSPQQSYAQFFGHPSTSESTDDVENDESSESNSSGVQLAADVNANEPPSTNNESRESRSESQTPEEPETSDNDSGDEDQEPTGNIDFEQRIQNVEATLYAVDRKMRYLLKHPVFVKLESHPDILIPDTPAELNQTLSTEPEANMPTTKAQQSLPKSSGTASSYENHQEELYKPPPVVESFHSICASVWYRNFSPEELRLGDYEKGQRYSIKVEDANGEKNVFQSSHADKPSQEDNLPKSTVSEDTKNQEPLAKFSLLGPQPDSQSSSFEASTSGVKRPNHRDYPHRPSVSEDTQSQEPFSKFSLFAPEPSLSIFGPKASTSGIARDQGISIKPTLFSGLNLQNTSVKASVSEDTKTQEAPKKHVHFESPDPQSFLPKPFIFGAKGPDPPKEPSIFAGLRIPLPPTKPFIFGATNSQDTSTKPSLFSETRRQAAPPKPSLFGAIENKDTLSKSSRFEGFNLQSYSPRPSLKTSPFEFTENQDAPIAPSLFGWINSQQSSPKPFIFGSSNNEKDNLFNPTLLSTADDHKSSLRSTIREKKTVEFKKLLEHHLNKNQNFTFDNDMSALKRRMEKLNIYNVDNNESQVNALMLKLIHIGLDHVSDDDAELESGLEKQGLDSNGSAKNKGKNPQNSPLVSTHQIPSPTAGCIPGPSSGINHAAPETSFIFNPQTRVVQIDLIGHDGEINERRAMFLTTSELAKVKRIHIYPDTWKDSVRLCERNDSSRDLYLAIENPRQWYAVPDYRAFSERKRSNNSNSGTDGGKEN